MNPDLLDEEPEIVEDTDLHPNDYDPLDYPEDDDNDEPVESEWDDPFVYIDEDWNA